MSHLLRSLSLTVGFLLLSNPAAWAQVGSPGYGASAIQGGVGFPQSEWSQLRLSRHQILLLQSELLLDLGRYAEALDRVSQVLAEDAENVDAWRLRGLILHRSGRHSEALAAYNQAIQILDRRYQQMNALAQLRISQTYLDHDRRSPAQICRDRTRYLTPAEAVFCARFNDLPPQIPLIPNPTINHNVLEPLW